MDYDLAIEIIENPLSDRLTAMQAEYFLDGYQIALEDLEETLADLTRNYDFLTRWAKKKRARINEL